MYQDPDIRIKQRELSKLQKQIELLSDAKTRQLRELSQQVALLKNEIEVLGKQNADLITSVSLLTRKKQELEDSIIETQETAFKKINENFMSRKKELDDKLKKINTLSNNT